MKHIAFILTMSSVGSWNGKWSGAGNLYAKIYTLCDQHEAQAATLLGNYQYNFGDGWVANVEVKEVTADQKQTLQEASTGFCGYDWMVDSIFKHGKILA
jgi:hypothetical protein